MAPMSVYTTLNTTKQMLAIIRTLRQYVINRTRHQFAGGDLSCRAASNQSHSITDYNGFNCILLRRIAPLVSSVDTVRAT